VDVLAVQLGDGEQRVVWALPRGQVVTRAQGPVWDLDADTTEPAALRWRWEDAVQSLRAWLAQYRPPIVFEHDHLDREPGQPVPARGHVVGLFTMTQQEAAGVGVDLRGAPEAVFFVLEPDAETREMLDAGQLPYTSPALRADYEDAEGTTWPIVLVHHSFVRDPRQKRRQVPVHDLQTLQDANNYAARLSEGVPYSEPERQTMTDQEMQAQEAPEMGAADALGELAEMVRQLAERMDRIESAMQTAEAAPDEAMQDAPTDEREAAMSELRAEVQRLSDELVRRDATEAVRAVMSEREVGTEAAELLTDLRIADAGRFDAFVALLPKRSAPKVARVTGPASAALSDLDVGGLTDGELARRIQQERAAAGSPVLFSVALDEARSMRAGG
jgi:hypothetical protein